MSEPLVKAIFTISGIFMIAGAAGLFRFKDFYLKVHCATMITVGGVITSLFLLALETSYFVIRMKIIALMILMLLTTPVSTHFIALAAYKHGIKMETRRRVVRT
jgi:multicomponent Na+:H+ antiporter subunit G